MLGVEHEFYISPSKDSLAQLFSQASVFIHAGIEDFGITPIEAMATGTPVVGPALGGLRDTVTSSSGVLVEDLKDLPNAVILAEKLNREQVSKNAARFTTERFRSEMLNVIKQA
jgi:glycosyltransferase involved in cell wall biosynthesis